METLRITKTNYFLQLTIESLSKVTKDAQVNRKEHIVQHFRNYYHKYPFKTTMIILKYFYCNPKKKIMTFLDFY